MENQYEFLIEDFACQEGRAKIQTN
eukprot:Gb_09653 [translate_table: standard]